MRGMQGAQNSEKDLVAEMDGPKMIHLSIHYHSIHGIFLLSDDICHVVSSITIDIWALKS